MAGEWVVAADSLASVIAATDLHWAHSRGCNGTGVLVLAGSSGRFDVARADLLASRGVTALALRWFGGSGQPPVPSEVPLETFTAALDLLAAECDRVVLLGLSYGAEAALLTAVRDPRVDAVVALQPSDVAWEGHRSDETGPPRSKWTCRGAPVPFVPMDRDWEPDAGPPSFRPWYEASKVAAGAGVVEASRIPVERFGGELVLVAGGDDQVWPSLDHARAISARRSSHGMSTTLVSDPGAGHAVVLPGEPVGNPARPYAVGGDAGGAQRLGERAWPAIRQVLRC